MSNSGNLSSVGTNVTAVRNDALELLLARELGLALFFKRR